jgi:DnaJ-class molecular chaperone
VGDYYDVLGISRSAGGAEVRKAYLKLARERHPDRFSDKAEKQKAEHDFQEITEAFNTLSNDRQRQAYDQSLEKPQATTPEALAEEAYSQGEAMLKAQDFGEAAAKFRAAAHHAPQQAKYKAALGRVLARNTQTSHEAAGAFEDASKLEPQNPDHAVELARLLMRQGLKIRARKVVEGAAHLAANSPDLKALAAELGPASPKKP